MNLKVHSHLSLVFNKRKPRQFILHPQRHEEDDDFDSARREAQEVLKAVTLREKKEKWGQTHEWIHGFTSRPQDAELIRRQFKLTY